MRETLRLAVFERDEFTCIYCGLEFPVREWDDAPWWMGGQRWRGVLHVDHFIPKSQGGTDELDNLVTACAECNLAKYNRTPEEWLGWGQR